MQYYSSNSYCKYDSVYIYSLVVFVWYPPFHRIKTTTKIKEFLPIKYKGFACRRS